MKIEITKPYRCRHWIVATEYGIAGKIKQSDWLGWHFECHIIAWGLSCPVIYHQEVYAAAKEKITILNILRRLTS